METNNDDSFVYSIDFTNVHAYEWADLWYAELDANIGLQALRILISNQEASFKLAHQKFKDQVENDESLLSLSEEQQGNYYSQIYEHEELAIDQLRRLQRYGICVSIFSFLESRLISLCRNIEDEFKYKIKAKDLADAEDISRYKHYFEKVFDVDLTSCDPYFTPLTQQKSVRNIITHQDGYFGEDQKKRVRIVTGLGIRAVGSEYEIQIKDVSYLHYLLDHIDKYLSQLFKMLDLRYKELRRSGRPAKA